MGYGDIGVGGGRVGGIRYHCAFLGVCLFWFRPGMGKGGKNIRGRWVYDRKSDKIKGGWEVSDG